MTPKEELILKKLQKLRDSLYKRQIGNPRRLKVLKRAKRLRSRLDENKIGA